MEQSVAANSSVQPVLSGFETILSVPRPPADLHTDGAVHTARALDVAKDARETAARPKGRRRYWSIRDLSRRVWYGRGYDVLRELVRSGLLPASRSARNWWLDDADVHGLVEAFDAPAGKVRAFRQLDQWLRQRAFAVPASPAAEVILRPLHASFIWRGTNYLPRATWQAQISQTGQALYRHQSGVALTADWGTPVELTRS